MKEKNKKVPFWMIRNSGGKKDVALTLMLATWVICCGLAIVGAIQTISYDDKTVEFNEFDIGFASVVFVPLAGLYFGRRYTDAQKEMIDTQKVWNDIPDMTNEADEV